MDGEDQEWVPLPLDPPTEGGRYGFQYYTKTEKAAKNLLWVLREAQIRWPVRADVLFARIHLNFRSRRKTWRRRRRSRSKGTGANSTSRPPIDTESKRASSDTEEAITFSGNNISPGFFASSRKTSLSSSCSEPSARKISLSSAAQVELTESESDENKFQGYPKHKVNFKKFPLIGKAPKEGWPIAYIGSYTNSQGKLVEREAMTCRTSGAVADLPGYIEIFKGPGDKVKPGWLTTLSFPKGSDTEFSFVTVDNEPLRNMQAVSNTLFVAEDRLRVFWEYCEFRKDLPWPSHWKGSAVKTKKNKAAPAKASHDGTKPKKRPKTNPPRAARGRKLSQLQGTSDDHDA